MAAEELLSQARSKGYKRGAHREEDCKLDQSKHIEETKKDQDSALDRYVLLDLLALR